MLVSGKSHKNKLEAPGARERALEAAERLFSEHGYATVTLRDIASSLGLSHASLYYHFPGGKESLFIEVTEQSIRRLGTGLDTAIEAAVPSLRPRLHAAAALLISLPPMDLLRMARTDMPALPEAEGRRLMNLVYEVLIIRLQTVLDEGSAAGEIRKGDNGLVAGALVGLIESVHAIPKFAVRRNRAEMACELVDVMLAGLGFATGGREWASSNC
jgi:AcrR family transcriptional regulator